MSTKREREHEEAESLRGPGRRRFLVGATGVLGVLTGATVGVPFVGAVIGSVFREKARHFADVTMVDRLPVEAPSDVTFPDKTTDAFLRETKLRSVWCVRHSATEVTVYSPICPHLGCRYDWRPGLDRFVCPCHGSQFALDGRVLAGPAPRPLDTLPTRIQDGKLFVEWETFKLGIPRKTPI